MSVRSCYISGSWKNIVIIWCCSIMVWISQLYFIICFMILITTFLFVGLYHNLNKPAADSQHNILWISKWLLETNNELKQAHQKMKVSFFSSWPKLAPDWTYVPNGSGSLFIVAIIIIIMIDWLKRIHLYGVSIEWLGT